MRQLRYKHNARKYHTALMRTKNTKSNGLWKDWKERIERYISMHFLTYLNLSGCTAVTNDAILALCSGTLPELSTLYLDGCHKVNNTALAWITDGLKDSGGFDNGDVSLVKLSWRGTK